MTSISQLENLMQRTLKKARLKACSPPYCPKIKLALFDPNVLEGPISHDEAQAIVAEPAYWSFCWASGQVLAAYIMNNPELVIGRTVVDMGTGSGVVAIAAALAGAKKVIACDIDPDALKAASLNASLNGVELECITSLQDLSQQPSVLTAADVLYDRDNHQLLNEWATNFELVVLGDSRMKVLPSDAYQLLETYEARTWPDLNEFEEFNQVRIYQNIRKEGQAQSA